MRTWFEKRGMGRGDVLLWILGMAVAFAWVSPFLWMVSTSFKYPADVLTQTIEWIPRRVTLDNYIKVFEYPVVRWTLNSVIQAVASTSICVFFGAMAGFALAQFRFPGRATIFLVFLASIMMPLEVSVIPMLLAFIKIGWASSYQALILPTIANVFSVYIFRQFFLSFPRELVEAARLDGAGAFRLFWLIALPLGAGAHDRRRRDHIHPQLEQFPVASPDRLRREHEDPSGGDRGLRSRGGNPYPA